MMVPQRRLGVCDGDHVPGRTGWFRCGWSSGVIPITELCMPNLYRVFIEVPNVIQHCFNPSCKAEFQNMASGELFCLERRSQPAVFLWMCAACTKTHTLAVSDAGEVLLHAGPSEMNRRPPHPDHFLRFIPRLPRGAPAGPAQRMQAEGSYAPVAVAPAGSGAREAA